MRWNDLYPKAIPPETAAFSEYVGSPLWDGLCEHIETRYGVLPKVEHSVCSGAPGWNVKYRKGGRALCTLYPDEGFFTCLVTVGSREETEAGLLMPSCTEAVRRRYEDTKPFNGARWLMIPVTCAEELSDVERLVALRVQKKKG